MSALLSIPALSHPGPALIARPNSAFREQVLQRLNGRCRPVQQALGGAEALAKLEKGDWQVLFLDRRLPDLDAEELLAVIRRRFPGTQVVMLDSDSAHCEDASPDVMEQELSTPPQRAKRAVQLYWTASSLSHCPG